MATVKENWQMDLSTVREKCMFIFNKELLSDVKFVAPVSNAESESLKVIAAHKLVLAISSPVFYAMFYGRLEDTSERCTDTVELPDCEYDSLLEFFRYLYTDEVNLTGSNVMHVLYLANKYMVPSLAEKCSEYLQANLEAAEVFSILPHAQKFEDKDLEDRCWEVIEEHTEEALTSDDFITLERSLVESVVKRERLKIKEVELFKAVDRWATKEGERQGATNIDGEVKRRIIGEDIIKAIRFPIMSQKEFVSVVFYSKILYFQEIGELMKHYSNIDLYSPLPFLTNPRACGTELHRCYRFAIYNLPGWSYTSGNPDVIVLSVNKSVTLYGIQHFGSEGIEYKVSTEIIDITNNSSLVKKTGTFSSEKDETHGFFGFDVFVNPPLQLHQGKRYEIRSLIKGRSSWHGGQGRASLECNKVQFNFYRSTGTANGTTENSGQFPAFIFS